jgi:hypothetical protein
VNLTRAILSIADGYCVAANLQPNAAPDPEGGTAAVKVTGDSAANTYHQVNWSITLPAGSYKFLAAVKAGEVPIVGLTAGNVSLIPNGSVQPYAVVDLGQGTLVNPQYPATIEPLGGGWYAVSLDFTTDGSLLDLQIAPANDATGTQQPMSGGVFFYAPRVVDAAAPPNF